MQTVRGFVSTPRVGTPQGSFPMAIALVPWLIGLRWAIVFVLVVALFASARWLALPVTWVIALPTVALLTLANLALVFGRARTAISWSATRIAGSVLFDMVAIAIVLAASGGAANPFSSLLFVYVALAASLLPARITYALACVAACVFGALFFVPQPADCPSCAARGGPSDTAFSSHLYGMWVAFALGAGLVVHFLTRVRSALEEQSQALAALQRRADESAKFAAIGTLAAGAAHELATPLGTIAILTGEIASTSKGEAPLARAIAAQVERCRDVLRRMQPGSPREETVGDASLGSTVEEAVQTWRAAHPEAEVIVRRAEDVTVAVSRNDLEAAVSVLLDNALYATEKAQSKSPIVVDTGSSVEGPFMSVVDSGTGLPKEIALRVGEPFLTTKEPGEGMGLGLYLIRTLIEHVGGRLEITDNAPTGTRVASIWDLLTAFDDRGVHRTDAPRRRR